MNEAIENSPEDFRKMKRVIQEVGLPMIFTVSIVYFFMLFLIPVLILSGIVYVFSISLDNPIIGILAIIVFIGYFIQDLFLISIPKMTITVGIMLAIFIVAQRAIKIFDGSISLFKVDESAPARVKKRIFPLNFMF